MKKLTLSLCCLILSGVSVDAVTFQNKSGLPVAAFIKLNTEHVKNEFRFMRNGEKKYTPAIFTSIYWIFVGDKTKTHIECPQVTKVGPESAETFILQKKKVQMKGESEYECVLQPPLS